MGNFENKNNKCSCEGKQLLMHSSSLLSALRIPFFEMNGERRQPHQPPRTFDESSSRSGVQKVGRGVHSTDGLGPAHALLVGPQGPAGKGVLLCGCHSCSSPLLTSRVKYSLLVAKNGSLFTCHYEGLHTPPLHVSLSLTLMSRVKASSVGSSQNPLFG